MTIEEYLKEILDKTGRIEQNTATGSSKVTDDDPKYIDGQRMKKEFGVSDRTLQTWRDKGIIPWCRFQRKIYYPWVEIKALLESQMNR
ncbi:MAG: hypothetical protein A2017_00010 [Lentisphaerae bacterium GWF2_44_16]|nr:MAG: hypothetical protein A2017_00010 [Lentisphaerae bacterium GWF2_44_16]